MKRRYVFLIGLAFISKGLATSYYQHHEKGWHWYESQDVPAREDTQQSIENASKTSPSEKASKKKSPKEVVASYREELENRLAAAWIDPSPQKIKAYQDMQKDLTDRSKAFSEGWMQSVFSNPTLDHTLVSPVNQRARHVHLDLEKKQVKETIQSLAKEYGLFFFFSGNCEYCHQFAPIVKQFSEQYGWEVLPISLDGGQLELFPNAQSDNGLFAQWQPGEQGQVMPALFAVNPNTGHVIPVALGMTGIDQMEIRIMSLVKV
jgi:conjugal transfer pilus assembly protein TraF